MAILVSLMITGCSKNPLTISQTVDLVGPQFSFTITNISSGISIEEKDATLDVTAGEKIEIRVDAIDYNEKADNNICVSLFDIEKNFKNQENVIMSIDIPSVESGKYPVTVVFDRNITSTWKDQWVGIKTNERTMYISVK